MTTSDKIKEITKKHLLNGSILFGQCLLGGGWASGTLPEMTKEEGLTDLSMADVAGGGIAVGAALAGKRPIYMVRFQGFQWYNATTIVNYAAKSKEMWGIPCPIFVRSLGTDSAGPVAGNSHHSIFTRMPGIPVCAPMTPGEYQTIWDYFMEHDDPLYVSEHRRSFSIDYEMENVVREDADITLLPISSTRLNAIDAANKLESDGIRCNIIHLLWLKPFKVSDQIIKAINNAKYGGVVIDGDHENGVVKCIAYDISQKTQKPVGVLALEERTAGFAPHHDNLPPTPEKIYGYVKKLIQYS